MKTFTVLLSMFSAIIVNAAPLKQPKPMGSGITDSGISAGAISGSAISKFPAANTHPTCDGRSPPDVLMRSHLSRS